MKKIIFSVEISPKQRERIEALAAGCKQKCQLVFGNAKTLSAADVKDADALIGSLPTELMNAFDHLEWHQISSAGADADVKRYDYSNTIMTNAGGAYDLSVAEHMVAQTMAMIRGLAPYVRQQSRHCWDRNQPVISIEESKIMVLGAGKIGTRYAKKMTGIGGYIVGVRRRPVSDGEKFDFYDEMHGLEKLDELLPVVDVVAMVLPGGEATTHIMDERRLRLMKKGAYILNVGRGSAIDPEGLYKVLSEGHLGGAALDVTEPEPLPEDSGLWDMENVIITPHSAGNFDLPSTIDRLMMILEDNLQRYLNDEPLAHIVNTKLGY
ncbi:MAG: D-2-hydroxyacid dehydrogenase [Firmicutes bacterium]|nr:D-2-hydroxyacid dehydrogenase [Bacillota bacterium]